MADKWWELDNEPGTWGSFGSRQAWEDAYEKEHGHRPGYGPESWEEAYRNLAWSQDWQRQHGTQPITEEVWKAHYYRPADFGDVGQYRQRAESLLRQYASLQPLSASLQTSPNIKTGGGYTPTYRKTGTTGTASSPSGASPQAAGGLSMHPMDAGTQHPELYPQKRTWGDVVNTVKQAVPDAWEQNLQQWYNRFFGKPQAPKPTPPPVQQTTAPDVSGGQGYRGLGGGGQTYQPGTVPGAATGGGTRGFGGGTSSYVPSATGGGSSGGGSRSVFGRVSVPTVRQRLEDVTPPPAPLPTQRPNVFTQPVTAVQQQAQQQAQAARQQAEQQRRAAERQQMQRVTNMLRAGQEGTNIPGFTDPYLREPQGGVPKRAVDMGRMQGTQAAPTGWELPPNWRAPTIERQSAIQSPTLSAGQQAPTVTIQTPTATIRIDEHPLDARYRGPGLASQPEPEPPRPGITGQDILRWAGRGAEWGVENVTGMKPSEWSRALQLIPEVVEVPLTTFMGGGQTTDMQTGERRPAYVRQILDAGLADPTNPDDMLALAMMGMAGYTFLQQPEKALEIWPRVRAAPTAEERERIIREAEDFGVEFIYEAVLDPTNYGAIWKLVQHIPGLNQIGDILLPPGANVERLAAKEANRLAKLPQVWSQAAEREGMALTQRIEDLLTTESRARLVTDRTNGIVMYTARVANNADEALRMLDSFALGHPLDAAQYGRWVSDVPSLTVGGGIGRKAKDIRLTDVLRDARTRIDKQAFLQSPQWRTDLVGTFADQVEASAIKAAGVKPWTRQGNVLKAAGNAARDATQFYRNILSSHALFLRPAYALRNAISDSVLRFMDGTMSFAKPEEMTDLLMRTGVFTEAGKGASEVQDIMQAGIGPLSKISQGIGSIPVIKQAKGVVRGQEEARRLGARYAATVKALGAMKEQTIVRKAMQDPQLLDVLARNPGLEAQISGIINSTVSYDEAAPFIQAVVTGNWEGIAKDFMTFLPDEFKAGMVATDTDIATFRTRLAQRLSGAQSKEDAQRIADELMQELRDTYSARLASTGVSGDVGQVDFAGEAAADYGFAVDEMVEMGKGMGLSPQVVSGVAADAAGALHDVGKLAQDGVQRLIASGNTSEDFGWLVAQTWNEIVGKREAFRAATDAYRRKILDAVKQGNIPEWERYWPWVKEQAGGLFEDISMTLAEAEQIAAKLGPGVKLADVAPTGRYVSRDAYIERMFADLWQGQPVNMEAITGYQPKPLKLDTGQFDALLKEERKRTDNVGRALWVQAAEAGDSRALQLAMNAQINAQMNWQAVAAKKQKALDDLLAKVLAPDASAAEWETYRKNAHKLMQQAWETERRFYREATDQINQLRSQGTPSPSGAKTVRDTLAQKDVEAATSAPAAQQPTASAKDERLRAFEVWHILEAEGATGDAARWRELGRLSDSELDNLHRQYTGYVPTLDNVPNTFTPTEQELAAIRQPAVGTPAQKPTPAPTQPADDIVQAIIQKYPARAKEVDRLRTADPQTLEAMLTGETTIGPYKVEMPAGMNLSSTADSVRLFRLMADNGWVDAVLDTHATRKASAQTITKYLWDNYPEFRKAVGSQPTADMAVYAVRSMMGAPSHGDAEFAQWAADRMARQGSEFKPLSVGQTPAQVPPTPTVPPVPKEDAATPLTREQLKSGIRRMADEQGVATATQAGKPAEQHVIRKYLPGNKQSSLERLSDDELKQVYDGLQGAAPSVTPSVGGAAEAAEDVFTPSPMTAQDYEQGLLQLDDKIAAIKETLIYMPDNKTVFKFWDFKRNGPRRVRSRATGELVTWDKALADEVATEKGYADGEALMEAIRQTVDMRAEMKAAQQQADALNAEYKLFRENGGKLPATTPATVQPQPIGGQTPPSVTPSRSWEAIDEPTGKPLPAPDKPIFSGATPPTQTAETVVPPMLRTLDRMGDALRQAIDTNWDAVQQAGLDVRDVMTLNEWAEMMLRPAYNDAVYGARNLAQKLYEFSMGSPEKQYLWDSLLQLLTPYPYWFSRQGPNTARRFLYRPGVAGAIIKEREWQSERREELGAGSATRLLDKELFKTPWGDIRGVDILNMMFPISMFYNKPNYDDEGDKGLIEKMLTEVPGRSIGEPWFWWQILLNKKGMVSDEDLEFSLKRQIPQQVGLVQDVTGLVDTVAPDVARTIGLPQGGIQTLGQDKFDQYYFREALSDLRGSGQLTENEADTAQILYNQVMLGQLSLNDALAAYPALRLVWDRFTEKSTAPSVVGYMTGLYSSGVTPEKITRDAEREELKNVITPAETAATAAGLDWQSMSYEEQQAWIREHPDVQDQMSDFYTWREKEYPYYTAGRYMGGFDDTPDVRLLDAAKNIFWNSWYADEDLRKAANKAFRNDATMQRILNPDTRGEATAAEWNAATAKLLTWQAEQTGQPVPAEALALMGGAATERTATSATTSATSGGGSRTSTTGGGTRSPSGARSGGAEPTAADYEKRDQIDAMVEQVYPGWNALKEQYQAIPAENTDARRAFRDAHPEYELGYDMRQSLLAKYAPALAFLVDGKVFYYGGIGAAGNRIATGTGRFREPLYQNLRGSEWGPAQAAQSGATRRIYPQSPNLRGLSSGLMQGPNVNQWKLPDLWIIGKGY